MSLSIKQVLFAFILIFCCILNPQDTTKENALGGNFMRHGKIFGPREPERLLKRGDYPFLVMVRIVGPHTERICSGSLASLQAVLTSSLCLGFSKTVTFWAGNCRYIYKDDFKKPTQHRKMRKSFVYEEVFGNSTVAYGTVSPAFRRTKYVKPVGLYLKYKQLPMSWHDNCYVLGFGVSSPVQNDSSIGRYMVQKIWSRVACYDMPPVPAHMCADKDAYNKTICGGDEGGPALCNVIPGKLQQFGVVDWRMSFPGRIMDLDCLLPQKENRYFYVGYFRDFLKRIPGFPKEEIYYDPIGQRRQPSEKLGGSRRLMVPVLILPVITACSALVAATITQC